VRKVASQRLKEWGRDQEEYMKRQHELIHRKDNRHIPSLSSESKSGVCGAEPRSVDQAD
jgi:hypothetical protein